MSTDTTPPPGAPEPNGAPEPTTHPDGQAPERDEQIATLNAENAKWRRQLREAQAELDRHKQATATDAERAVAAARAEGAQQYATKWRRALLENAALNALADKGVTAIEPALRSLDLDDIEIDDEGHFDKGPLAHKVDELIRRYPVFAPQDGRPALPTVNGDTQHRVVGNQVPRGGKLSDAEASAMLRYGLGAER